MIWPQLKTSTFLYKGRLCVFGECACDKETKSHGKIRHAILIRQNIKHVKLNGSIFTKVNSFFKQFKWR